MKTKRFYRFGPFSIDTAAKVVAKEGQPLHLTRKAVETLLVLAENCGQVVTKEEVIAAVWPDRVVDEANLKQNVAMIRRTLAVNPGDPGFIETYAGRGYRMLGPAELVEEEVAPVAPRTERAGPPAWRNSKALIPVLALLSVALAVWIWLALRGQPRGRAEFRMVPLTRLAGKEFQPAVSPDGTKVAFLWMREGSGTAGIRIQIPGRSDPQPIETQAGRCISPAWSPDGGSLAYLRAGKSSTDVLIRDLKSGEERLISALPSPDLSYDYRLLDWSPDGNSLVVVHSESLDVEPGLFLIDIRSKQRRRLTRPEGSVGGDVDPRFSPDGRSVSFIRLIHRSNQELYSVPVGGGSPKQLTGDGKRVTGHDWMPDGAAIVFSSDRGGEFRLWRIDPNAGNPGRGLRSLDIYGEFPIQLSIARNSPTLVYSVLHQDRNIWRLDLKEKRWARVVASSGQDASPQYSPAGDRICFRSDRSGEDQLWVSSADGSNPVPVTSGSLWPSVGHWSPDGASIVFNNARTGEIFISKQSAGGGWEIERTGAQGVHPIFSADGRWIYAGGAESIVRVTAKGEPVSEVVTTRALSLSLSADGGFLYFMREPYGSALWKASVDSGGLTKVLDGVIPSCTSCWALAGDGIYYLGADSHSFDGQILFFHSFRTEKARKVVAYPEPLPPLGSGPFSLSPDGRYLLCVRLDPSNSDLIRVEPFR